jgi:hypothetical protein
MTRDKAASKPKNGYQKWLWVLDDFDVQYLVLDTGDDRSLFEAIRSQPDWTIDFRSGSKALLARTTGA